MRDGPKPYLVVVPRGERATFRALEERVSSQGLVEIIWDRRVGERRKGDRRSRPTDAGRRRLGDRRRTAATDTWALGFVVATRYERVLEPTKTIEKAGPGPTELSRILGPGVSARDGEPGSGGYRSARP
jgi:hypothetical protein